ncbi:OsmC family protein [Actinokineospora xionganensis]|uniref:OsmC family protein n=1 Tax=Actinokineospora xionganensis TaxID=2684470 RepID=A0ABR7KZR6_9PSEU|nr:OsmC family protein [Actinokineospora xionganensis]MBC6445842.1 OsmC family protein [Actinokineospora xionganensis]
MGDDRFQIQTRGHVVLADQPRGDDGVEVGPTPVELFVMSLATCAAHYAAGYLRHQGLPQEDLRVECRWTMRADPPRVGRVELTVVAPVPLDADRTAALLAAVDHCTVQNSLRQPPEVRVAVAEMGVVSL